MPTKIINGRVCVHLKFSEYLTNYNKSVIFPQKAGNYVY